MKNRRLLLLIVCAAALTAYAVWSGSAGSLLMLAGGGDAAAVAETPAPAAKAAGGDKPAETVPLNPLAGTAVEQFAEIVDRPLFNPTRAPPPAVEEAAAAEVVEPAPADPQDSAKPEDFTLLAIAIADDARIAVVRWNKTNEVFHLKQGQFLSDWELRSVGEKEVTIGRDDTAFSLKLFERARPVGAQAPAEMNPEEMQVNPGGQAVEPEDKSEADPALNSN
jgi:general secretion pathway protein N